MTETNRDTGAPKAAKRWVAHKRFTHLEMHHLLIEKCLSARYKKPGREWIASQALHCPYYVAMEGRLGADWGVIVNPESSRFAKLTFEHDDCGCPGPDEARHKGSPDQDGDMWDKEWQPSPEDEF
jgi:hypothetical protein